LTAALCREDNLRVSDAAEMSPAEVDGWRWGGISRTAGRRWVRPVCWDAPNFCSTRRMCSAPIPASTRPRRGRFRMRRTSGSRSLHTSTTSCGTSSLATRFSSCVRSLDSARARDEACCRAAPPRGAADDDVLRCRWYGLCALRPDLSRGHRLLARNRLDCAPGGGDGRRRPVCGVAGWTLPWSRLAATPATRPRGRPTKPPGSRSSLSRATSGCWTDQHQPQASVRLG
jgi:hypothetical protein